MGKYDKALQIIKHFEGIKDGDTTTPNLDPYLDPVGIWTIGWGHTICDKHGVAVRGKNRIIDAYMIFPGGITLEKAERLLKKDMRIAIKAVKALVKVPLKNHQLNALISWTFNLGAGSLKRSALLRLLNLGDYGAVPAQMRRWNKAGGKVLYGLTKRRAAEAKLWSEG